MENFASVEKSFSWSLVGSAAKFTVSAVTGAVLVAMSPTFSNAAPFGPMAVYKPAPLKIIAFGSSSTEGVGAKSPAGTYPAQLQSLLTQELPSGHYAQVVNRGVGGEDADDMMKRLQRDVISRHPDIVIWQTGSNDPVRKVPLDRFERETRDGIAAMRQAGIKVILMEPQWCPKLESIATSSAFRDTIRRIGQDTNVEVIRRSDLMHDWIREGLLTRGEMLAPDGLHMTDGGYAQLARDVAPKVLELAHIDPAPQKSVAR